MKKQNPKQLSLEISQNEKLENEAKKVQPYRLAEIIPFPKGYNFYESLTNKEIKQEDIDL